MKRDRSCFDSSTGEEFYNEKTRLCLTHNGSQPAVHAQQPVPPQVISPSQGKALTHDSHLHQQRQQHFNATQPLHHVNQTKVDHHFAPQPLQFSPLEAQHIQQQPHMPQHAHVAYQQSTFPQQMPSLHQMKPLNRSFGQLPSHSQYGSPQPAAASPPGHAPIKRSNSCPLLVELEQGGIAIAKEDEQQELLRQQVQQSAMGLHGGAPKWL